MENIKDVINQIDVLNKKIEDIFERLNEIELIEIWLKTVWKTNAKYWFEKMVLNSQINNIKLLIEDLRKKDIVGLNWEVI